MTKVSSRESNKSFREDSCFFCLQVVVGSVDREMIEYDLKSIEINPSPDVFECEAFQEEILFVLEVKWL